MAPVTTYGAIMPVLERPAMKVCVFHPPKGAVPSTRVPLRERPRGLVRVVLTDVSSMKTRRSMAMRGCLRLIQMRRRRSTLGLWRWAATSVFLYM